METCEVFAYKGFAYVFAVRELSAPVRAISEGVGKLALSGIDHEELRLLVELALGRYLVSAGAPSEAVANAERAMKEAGLPPWSKFARVARNVEVQRRDTRYTVRRANRSGSSFGGAMFESDVGEADVGKALVSALEMKA